jgi:phytoene dehydrogenase-like protein
MKQNGRKIVIVGGGIAGLCAAVYAQKCGYQAEVLEMHDMAGGLAMSWRRGGYTFETCLHWLFGSNPNTSMHGIWREVCDIDRLTIVYPEELARLETEHGDSLSIYTSIARLEAEMLKRAPQDTAQIRRFASAVRRLGKFKMPDPAAGWASNLMTLLGDAPCLPLLRELGKMSGTDYGKQFSDPLLQSFFGSGLMGRLTSFAMVITLAWMNMGDSGYPIGGSQALIRLIEEKLLSLGGQMRFGARVERILVQDGAAVGVELAGGETVAADWVISAADGHATLYDLLGGKYIDKVTEKKYNQADLFPSYLQVSLGVARDLSGLPASLTRILDSPLEVDPGTQHPHVGFRIFHFDPTFAPAGKTAVTCFLPTYNHEYWVHLREQDPAGYRAEKHRVAEAVIAILEKKVPDLRTAIETVDVSTPASVVRYTGNWKGSMEGWFMPAGGSMRPLPKTLPGLRRFLMAGQWISPGGGLPSGPMTARPAIQAVCKQDRVPFTPR